MRGVGLFQRGLPVWWETPNLVRNRGPCQCGMGRITTREVELPQDSDRVHTRLASKGTRPIENWFSAARTRLAYNRSLNPHARIKNITRG